MSYYIVEVFSRYTKEIAKVNDFERAVSLAQEHSARTGLLVEIQDELGRILGHEIAWREQ